MTIKKSRIDGDQLLSGDEQADWYAQYGDLPPRRVSKESLRRRPAAGYMYMDGQEGSKRVNGILDKGHVPVDEAVEGIAEDEATEFRVVVRGKKRDRAEAGSTFGVDDDDDTRNGRASHHRKRRTILRRKVEAPARGRKRDREAESPESDGEEGSPETSRRPAQRSSRKKRGKRAVSDEVGEISVEDPCVSKDPLCNGRRIGDEWEADGVQYKVSDNGEQLRLTLVKKARNKYHMVSFPRSSSVLLHKSVIQPLDSQHPDRSAALEIYVETWMTDEQYKQAEGKQELAWQEAPRESSGAKASDVLDSPAKNGKDLLWDSVKGSPARRPFRQFMPAGASTRLNPFEQWQLQPSLGRRVASSSTTVSSILPGVSDSPTRPGFRGFSKWEKQDREAEALARIRAKIEEKKAQAPSQKPIEIPTSVTAPELSPKTLSVPTITLTPAPVVTAEGGSNHNISQRKANTSTSIFATPSTGDSIKDGAAAATTTGFMPPSTSAPAPTPSTLFPSPPTAPTTISSVSVSPVSFAKPPPIPLSAPTPTSSSATYERGTGAGMPSVSASSPCTLGITTQSRPSTEGAFKPTPSFFAKLDPSPPPALVVPPTTKPQVPNFGATSSSSPVAFGLTSATAKAEAAVPLPASTSATALESSKPTAPLFSFSGTSSSTATHPPSSAPKFSFGQPPTTSAFMPSTTVSQPKPTFKLGQGAPGASDGNSASTVLATDESKKPAVPVSVLGTATGLNEPVKSAPFGIVSAFGGSTSTFPSVAVDSGASTSTPPKSTLASTSTTTLGGTLSSTPAGPPSSGNTPVFSFGVTNSGSKSAEGSKPASLFGGATGGPNPVPVFGGSSTEKKPTFMFGATTESSKSTPIFGGGTEGSKPPFFGGSAEVSKPPFAFGSSAETSKPVAFGGISQGSNPTFAFSGITENKPTSGLATGNSKSLNATDISGKLTSVPVTATFGSSPSASTFTFGKEDAATSSFTSTTTQPAASFTFGMPSGATGSAFGQPSTSATSGDSSQSLSSKPTSTTPSAFGFIGTGSSGSSTFTFGKPAAQNQKQEQ